MKRETPQAEGRLVFEFAASEIKLLDEHDVPVSTYRFDLSRSALQNVVAVGAAGETLGRFGEWLRSIHFFQIQPGQMDPLSGHEHRFPSGYQSQISEPPRQDKRIVRSELLSLSNTR